MKIDIRMNLKKRRVELKTRTDTPDISNLQKCTDFVHAFMLGFDVCDAVALLRLDELYDDSFEIKDVKTLRVIKSKLRSQRRMAEYSEHKEESLMEKIADKTHFDRSSSSLSDSDSEVKHTATPVKGRIWRLFGREKLVHHVLGGGKHKLN